MITTAVLFGLSFVIFFSKPGTMFPRQLLYFA